MGLMFMNSVTLFRTLRSAFYSRHALTAFLQARISHFKQDTPLLQTRTDHSEHEAHANSILCILLLFLMLIFSNR